MTSHGLPDTLFGFPVVETKTKDGPDTPEGLVIGRPGTMWLTYQRQAEAYAKAVDLFLHRLGVTVDDENIRLVQFANNQDLTEVRRRDDLLGTITTGFDRSDHGGIQFVITCTPLKGLSS